MRIFENEGLYGAIDEDGNEVISPKFKEMYPFNCGLSLVRNEKFEYAYIDISGRQVIPFGKYTWCDPLFVCGFARVEQNGKKGIIDTQGKVIVSIVFDQIWPLNEKYLSVKTFIGEKERIFNLEYLIIKPNDSSATVALKRMAQLQQRLPLPDPRTRPKTLDFPSKEKSVKRTRQSFDSYLNENYTDDFNDPLGNIRTYKVNFDQDIASNYLTGIIENNQDS